MQIWVDADACPGPIREILYRAAERCRVRLILVANQPLRTPGSRYIGSLQVPAGFDAADHEIVRRCREGDLVITADIPLASAVIDEGAHALSPRGERFTPDTVRERLNMRDFVETLRASGMASGGPPPLGQRERQDFANQLDRFLARK